MLKVKLRDLPLAIKLTSFITILIFTVVSCITWLRVHNEKKLFRNELENQAQFLLDALAIYASNSLYKLDMDPLTFMVDRLSWTSLITSCYVYGPEGRIIAKPRSEQIQKLFQTDPFGKQLLQTDETLFRWESDYLKAGQCVVVGRQKLGAVSITFDTIGLTRKINSFSLRGFIIGLVAILIGTILASIISYSITNPIKTLVKATEQLSEGQTFETLPDGKQDEIGILAHSFNAMAGRLQDTMFALRESEEKFRSLSDNSIMGIAIIQDDVIKYVNASLSAIVDLPLKKINGVKIDAEYVTFIPDVCKSSHDRRIKKGKKKNRDHNYFSFQITTQKKHTKWLDQYVKRIPYQGKDACLIMMLDGTLRKNAEEAIKSSLAEKEVLLQEIHHRVKNNLQVITSLLNLQAQQNKDRHTTDILKECNTRVRTMALVHEKLYQSRNLSSINFADYARNLFKNVRGIYAPESNSIKANLEVQNIDISIDAAVPCGLIMNELLSNVFKYAFPLSWPEKKEMTLGFKRLDDLNVELMIQDNGVGLPEDIDVKNAKTLGLRLVQLLSEGQLQGNLTVENDGGTTFKIQFKNG